MAIFKPMYIWKLLSFLHFRSTENEQHNEGNSQNLSLLKLHRLKGARVNQRVIS